MCHKHKLDVPRKRRQKDRQLRPAAVLIVADLLMVKTKMLHKKRVKDVSSFFLFSDCCRPKCAWFFNLLIAAAASSHRQIEFATERGTHSQSTLELLQLAGHSLVDVAANR